MRVLFCKIHCPSFICFCKPSTATHLYNHGPLKLENSHQALPPSDPSHQNHVSLDVEEIIEVEEKENLEDGKQEPESVVVLRSCMKNKENSESRSSIERKKVQWMDNLGKELVDIKEFESRLVSIYPFFVILL